MVREISLTQGMVALVDDADYEWLNQWRWCTANRYAASASVPDGDGGKRRETMHRLLMGSPEGMDVHHKNGNSLDNRRDNLQVLAHSEHKKFSHPKSRTGFLQIRVTPQTHEAIIKLAEAYDVPRCQIVRWAIAEYVEKAEREANDD